MVKTSIKICSYCDREFRPAGRGRTPKYCSDGCKRNADRAKHRQQYVKVSVKDALLQAVDDGYWLRDPWADPDAPTAHAGMTVHEAIRDDSGMEWTVSRADAGLRSADRWSATPSLGVLGAASAGDSESYPSGKNWADKGADLDIEIIRRKDRSRFGGPVGAWEFGPVPREPGWMPVDEWLGSLPDDGKGWVNGVSVNPALLF